MRLTIAAVGRLKSGPEADLITDYLGRVDQVGRPLALGPTSVIEIDERKAKDTVAQGQRLIAAIPENATAIALDERGKSLTSPKFATLLADLRDQGRPELAFLIGGADGHGKALRALHYATRI